MKKVVSIFLMITLAVAMCCGALYADEAVFEEDTVSEAVTVFEEPSSWDEEEYVTEDTVVFDEEDVSEDASLDEDEPIWQDEQIEDVVSEDAATVVYEDENLISDESGIFEDEIIREDTITKDPALTSGTCGDDLTWEVNEENGTLTISGSGKMEDYDYYSPWLDDSELIVEVILSDGITNIGNYAFNLCHNLASINIPNSVKSIGVFAFRECESLTSITIPNSVTSIGNEAFIYCTSLTSITIPNSVTSIGDFAFSACYSLTSITIPNSVTSIGDYAFSACESLTIYGCTGSYVEKYAKNHNIPFKDPTLKSMSLEVPEPVPGELPSEKIKITFDPPGAIKSSFYKDMEWSKYYMVSDDDSNYKVMSEGEKFELGKYYASNAAGALAIAIAFGASFDPDAVFNYDVANTISEDFFATVNGQKVTDGIYRFGKLGERVSLTAKAVSDIPDQTYTGKAIKPAPVVVVDDKKLVQDTDYTVSYKNNTNAGTASLTVTGKGKYTGSVKKTFTIKPASVSNAVITGVKDKVYTGKALTQAITVKVGSKKLEAGTDYTESYKNNKNVGTATLTIKGKGNYTGTATAKFKIIPQGTTISSMTAGKKSFTVKWKKQATQTDGYLIQYSTDKDFKKDVKTKTIKKVGTTKATIDGLAGAKTYYVRICTYKLVNGKKYCSTWSKMKSVKTNK